MAGRKRDIDLGRKQLGPSELVPVLMCEGLPDGCGGGLEVARARCRSDRPGSGRRTNSSARRNASSAPARSPVRRRISPISYIARPTWEKLDTLHLGAGTSSLELALGPRSPHDHDSDLMA